jgi:argininosuccinate lyase
MSSYEKPIWDRGDAIDLEMLKFTIGDDWLLDRRLVEQDLRGSMAWSDALLRGGWLDSASHAAIRDGLATLLASHRRGEWTVDETDEDVHSAVERRLIELIGEPGKRLHTGRSRNEQIALDVLLWIRESTAAIRGALDALVESCATVASRHGKLPIPGYTHLRRAMPSTLAQWAAAYGSLFTFDRGSLERGAIWLSACPLGSGAGYGSPVGIDRAALAAELGFDRAAEPATLVQLARGRAELEYVTSLEGIALGIEKLCFDLWLFTSKEFGFAKLPIALTTGSSLMPQKRNPDLLELMRAHARQVSADRAALAAVLRDLPSGYHRDFQLLKGPLFRAHDRMAAILPLASRALLALEWNKTALETACDDPALRATERAIDRVRRGVPFRDAYREESSQS